VSSATLWLVDEPLSSLDPSRAAQAIETLTGAARERGATLLASLHQVEVAKVFPRVLGMRDGELQFDLPGAEVGRAQLAALYAQHEHELLGAAPAPEPEPGAVAPVVMHCR
jgi:phosphonate transport system ATP-binding protein